MPKTAEGTFGSRLAGHRRILEMPQAAIAKRAGITQRHLSKLENNASEPSWKVAVRLADALNASLDYLAGRSL